MITIILKKEIKYLWIETVHDLQNIPYKSLLNRFSPNIIKRLRQITGIEPELISYLKEKKIFSRSVNLPEPIGLITDLLELFKRLAISLCKHLEINSKGTRTLDFKVYKVDSTQQTIQIKVAELTAKPANFIELFKSKIHQIEAGFGIDFIRVSASKVGDLLPVQHHLQVNSNEGSGFSQAIVEKEKYKNLISCLGSKLGFDNLMYLHPNESHIPEKRSLKVAAAYCSPALIWPLCGYQRPTLIFKPEPIKIIEYKKFPKTFIWQKKKYSVAIYFGPERISPEWWLNDPQWHTGLRDYWKVESICGTKLWLFEAKSGKIEDGWFIHGNFI